MPHLRRFLLRLVNVVERNVVMQLILRRSMVLVGIGLGVGLAGAAAVARFLQGMLFGVTSFDPVTLIGVSLLFGAVALLASYVPAHRATRIDPLIALRCE